MIKDYKVKIIVKNNLLMKAINGAGYESIASFCRASGLAVQTVGCALNLKTPLYNNSGIAKIWLDLSNFLKILPEDLIPTQHYNEPLKINTVSVEMNLEEVKQIATSETNAEELLLDNERDKAVNDILKKLTPKQENIIRMRFGIGQESCTLEKVSRYYGVSKERIRQQECKAISMLKKPENAKYLRVYLIK